MRERGLIFGGVFLLAGILLLIGTSFEFDHRSTTEAQLAQEHPNGWHPFTEPSVFEEGAAWAGMLSALTGIVLVVGRTIQVLWRRQAK